MSRSRLCISKRLQRLFPDKSSRAPISAIARIAGTVKAELCSASPCYVEGQDLLGRQCVFTLIAFSRHTITFRERAFLYVNRSAMRDEKESAKPDAVGDYDDSTGDDR